MSISLKIKGNKRGNEGVGADLVSIGTPFPVIDQQYNGAGTVTDFIIVRHLADKSVYTIMTKNVTPCDSQRQGTLLISASVPTGKHVIGLFNMLLELSGFYKSNYMSYDGKMYHFTSRPEQTEGFDAILSKYTVAGFPYHPVKMKDDSNAVAYLYMTPAQISELLEDPMRDEFSQFGQVVLVPVADPSIQQSTISVPSKNIRQYKIYVNGRRSPQIVSDPTKLISISIPETASNYAASVRFTLGDARSSKLKGIVADDFNQIIYVNLETQKKEVAVKDTQQQNGDSKYKRDKITLLTTTGAVAIIIALALCYIFGAFGNSPTEAQQKENQKEKIENDLTDGGKPNDATEESRGNNDDFEEFAKSVPKEGDGNNSTGNNTEAEKIKSEKENKTGNNESEKPESKQQPDQGQTDPQLLEAYNAAIRQLASAKFTYDDLESYKKLKTRSELGEDRISKITRAISLHENAITVLSDTKCSVDDYKKAVSDNAETTKRTLPELSKKLREISSISNEDIETYRLDFSNRHKRKGQQPVY